MAGDDDSDSIPSRDSTDLVPPPSKKPKIETVTEAKAEEDADTMEEEDTDTKAEEDSVTMAEEEADTKEEEDSDSEEEIQHQPTSFIFNGRVIRIGELDDPEYVRQRDLFYKQLRDSEGFDVDWDSFDYQFNVLNFEWNLDLDEELSQKEVLQLLIQSAIEEHDEEHGTKLKYLNYVSANIVGCKGLLYYITFRASDLNSSSPQESKLYQAKVQRFCDEITVRCIRLKPAQ